MAASAKISSAEEALSLEDPTRRRERFGGRAELLD